MRKHFNGAIVCIDEGVFLGFVSGVPVAAVEIQTVGGEEDRFGIVFGNQGGEEWSAECSRPRLVLVSFKSFYKDS